MRENVLWRGNARRLNVFGNALGGSIREDMKANAAAPANMYAAANSRWRNAVAATGLADDPSMSTDLSLRDRTMFGAAAAQAVEDAYAGGGVSVEVIPQGEYAWDPVDELGPEYQFDNMLAEQRAFGGSVAIAPDGRPYEQPWVGGVPENYFDPIVGMPLSDLPATASVAMTTRPEDSSDTSWLPSKAALSTVLDMVPGIGTLKAGVQVITGHDVLTGEPVNRWAEGAGILVGLIPGGKAVAKGIVSDAEAQAVRGLRATPSSEMSRAVIGRMDDLRVPNALRPGEYTIADKLPHLGGPKANYYQNMSVLREEMGRGVPIRDASSFRPDTELAPTPLWPERTIRQTFTGAERNQLRNREWTFDGEYWNPPR